jgi:hypothetical protein
MVVRAGRCEKGVKRGEEEQNAGGETTECHRILNPYVQKGGKVPLI